MLETVAFYGLAAVILGGGLACVIAGSIVRAAVGLLAALGGVAGLFVLLAANFLAAVQLIVYAGGVLVLIIFGIMLTARGSGAAFAPRWNERVGVGLTLVALVSAILYAIFSTPMPSLGTQADAVPGVRTIGESLLTTWLLPFELISVLLLAVLIGAAHLARPARSA
ncbi:MAG: NADH-quinone oxidoreductase subunit J [Phycisphaerales bacterium]|nr:NADH-quinone oxidoreductase subunit J [Phycisphaerales bacterium]